MTIQFVDTPEQLEALCQKLSDSDWLAVDTEFLREKTYFPQLCLIQIADTDSIACIDPLSIEDLSPLMKVLYNEEVTLIFHAARQDLELFYLLTEQLPAKVFDTQLAATVLGYGDQIGYANLVKKCLDIDIDKTQTRTDWSQRPLSEAQIEYAAADVDHLRFVYEQLKEKLEQTGRTTWLDSDFSILTAESTYKEDAHQSWQRIRGAGKLKPSQLAVLQQLALWRENKAIQLDKPRRWLLKDDALLDLARFAPTSVGAMKKVRSLDHRDVDRHGEDLLSTIQLGKQTAQEDWPSIKKVVPLSNPQEAIADALMALLKQSCAEQNITPSAVATRKDIEALIKNEDTSLTEGWRYEVAGQTLTQFLNGDISISASPEQLIIK